VGISNWAPEWPEARTGFDYLTIPSGGNFDFPMGSTAETEEFSIVVHCTPDVSLLGDSGGDAQYNYILSKSYDRAGGTLTNGFAMFISGANANNPYIFFKHGTTSFQTKTPIDIDGSSFNIIYTYKKNSSTGADGRLYINGVLEAYEESCDNLSTTDKDLIIGGVGDNAGGVEAAQVFRGSIEEIIFYEKELVVPQKKSRIYL